MNTYSRSTPILGFILPDGILEFLNDDAQRNLNAATMRHVFGVDLGGDLKCGCYALESETLALRKIQSETTAQIYGLQKDSRPDSGKLDADHCLCFGANLDEEGICLDYRDAPECPSVVIGVWRGQPNENAVWIPLASSFSEFLKKYQSSGQPFI